MPELRPEEIWASQMIEHSLGASVRQHDDGTADGMHDLTIDLPDGPTAAVEVTSAVDSEFVELWKIVNDPSAPRWCHPSIAGGWSVVLDPKARGRRILRDLVGLLSDLEAVGRRRVDTAWASPPFDDDLTRRASDLRIVTAAQNDTSFPGSI